MFTFKLSIDCAPGNPRPDFYFDILKSKFKMSGEKCLGKFFGEWTWVGDIPKNGNTNSELQAEILENLKSWYNKGCIRYGSIVVE